MQDAPFIITGSDHPVSPIGAPSALFDVMLALTSAAPTIGERFEIERDGDREATSKFDLTWRS